MDEKKMNAVEMSDKELDKVQGGEGNWRIVNGRYYKYIGGDQDLNRKYVCPKCGRRLNYGTAWRYYCDECKESWFFEANLLPNLNSGVWQEIRSDEYYEGYWGV